MKLTSPAEPHRVLADLAAARATGALHIGSDPPGLLQLVDGRVTHAASPLAPGVGDLLTIGGRLPVEVWQSAVDAGIGEHRVGGVLLEQGHLTRGELELCVLSVIYDAAYFVLVPHAVPVRFEPDRPHWLGPVAAVPAAKLSAEVDRRRRLLDEILDRPAVDAAPVVPVPRIRRDRVRLTSLQWELIVHSDGQRSATDLARHLGRAAYACLQEVRRLVADGLLQPPVLPPPGPAAPAGGGDPRGSALDPRAPAAVPRQWGAPGERGAARVALRGEARGAIDALTGVGPGARGESPRALVGTALDAVAVTSRGAPASAPAGSLLETIRSTGGRAGGVAPSGAGAGAAGSSGGAGAGAGGSGVGEFGGAAGSGVGGAGATALAGVVPLVPGRTRSRDGEGAVGRGRGAAGTASGTAAAGPGGAGVGGAVRSSAGPGGEPSGDPGDGSAVGGAGSVVAGAGDGSADDPRVRDSAAGGVVGRLIRGAVGSRGALLGGGGAAGGSAPGAVAGGTAGGSAAGATSGSAAGVAGGSAFAGGSPAGAMGGAGVGDGGSGTSGGTGTGDDASGGAGGAAGGGGGRGTGAGPLAEPAAPGRGSRAGAAVASEPRAPDTNPGRGFRLPRRKPSQRPRQAEAELAPAADEALLLRLRSALRGMA
ncbi:hypothetical protein GCM10010123_27120 [Pilimelia anulata]|uniref:PatA-like N-terminal domain-containing protein n=1 Tax=Pilimelia anulata TaxID=53371 RepID=A0A8J3FA52_9ACTN|nr:DUF4388 domain-containing protein [Pilimelia anulata]GGJ95805.1 hypothetical protein GCM10010123_27120 [Pilimelia anulata]